MKKITLNLIEGMPGVGKTTFSRSLYNQISMATNNCNLYLEETCQPIDLFRQAVLSKTEYNSLVHHYPDNEYELERNSFFTGEYQIIAYTMLTCAKLVEKLRAYDIGDGRTSFDQYKNYHLMLWKYFASTTHKKRTDWQYISEGSFLHNQLFDIVGFYTYTIDELLDYFGELINILSVSKLRIKLYYLYVTNIPRLVDNTIIERGVTAGTWGAGFENWLKESPYGRNNSLIGRTGMIQAYSYIDELARIILRQTNAPVEYIDRTHIRCYESCKATDTA